MTTEFNVYQWTKKVTGIQNYTNCIPVLQMKYWYTIGDQ